MPTFYAHYKFGQEVKASLPDNLREIVEAHQSLYDIGLHGPDILFFYHPLRRHRIGKQGIAIHHEKGSVFFENAAKKIVNQSEPAAMLAYTFGCVCHLALDAGCHPFINQYEKQSGISHHEIEKELEKSLLRQDGFDPFHYYHSEDRLINAMILARVIAPLYDATPAQIYHCVESFKWYLRLFFSTAKWKRTAIFTGMRMSGTYKSTRGFFTNRKDNDLCAISNRYLEQQMVEQVPVAEAMIEEFNEYCHDGSPLSEWFDRTFS